jgi:hypothetical protein
MLPFGSLVTECRGVTPSPVTQARLPCAHPKSQPLGYVVQAPEVAEAAQPEARLA